jgi:hypothetical protein
MSERNTRSQGGSRHPPVRRACAVLGLVVGVLGVPALAGETGSSFRVSVTLLPATPTCTASVDAGAVPQVACRPQARLPVNQVMLAAPIADVGVDDQRFVAWIEYSSRLVVTRSGEYLEMTVTW